MPLWVLVLAAAGGDPLRAQEIEAQITPYWWSRWLVYDRERARADEEKLKKLRDG